LQASDPELRAMMRNISLRGYDHEGTRLEPAECLAICEYVIQESLSLHRSLDLRLLVNSFQDFVQWNEGDSGCHWRDPGASRLRERPTTFREPVMIGGCAAWKEKELDIVREIVARTGDRQERLSNWRERTGKSQAAFYRRLTELNGK